MADTKKYKVGVTVKEPWAANISYERLDMTLNAIENGGDGCAYTALKDNIGIKPGTDPTVWAKSSERGQSIYDYCVEYGLFEGTEEEFAQTYTDAVNGANTAASNANQTNERVTEAEESRVSAEAARESAEDGRVSAEAARVSAEEQRATAENARADAESGRVGAEQGRVTAEGERETAEEGRVSAEAGRVTAEEGRVSEWGGLTADVATAIGQADAATTRAVNAALQSEELNEHPMRISPETYTWERWDSVANRYVNTGIMAMGSPYATFEIDPATGELMMSTDEYYAGPVFSLNAATGNLQITI